MPPRRFPSSSSIFGQRLRQARARAGLPQDRLGVLAGLEESSSSARISRYESGVHEPPLLFTESLARVLGVPAAYFYCKDDRLAEIILHYADMSEPRRSELQAKAAELAQH
ncbi:helix-turn-helix transcriptional regulator [Massilia sp. YIM B02769]|uniref:helix-turn-helix domain-containing protein n=1 Tax=Massilia sp. YIM B02769 TaxID=3050129 RepID=UPI0025B62FF9|nr:helix-turn-helix transcriptional regulator [Massilia sp. YIM B02769]MDN4061312.1 helix-turn-helix transcriptional regulator [Massilia sp. YIM B02769]